MDAQKAAKRAAEKIAPSFKAFYTQRDVDLAAVDILAEFAPLLAAKDAEIERLAKALDDNWVTHQQVIAANSERDRLADEVAELRRDAERYRHCRSVGVTFDAPCGIFDGDRLDELVDREIAEKS